MTRVLRIRIGQRIHDRSRPGIIGVVTWIFPRHYSVRTVAGSIKRVRNEHAALHFGDGTNANAVRAMAAANRKERAV